jgi:hypothetical protein
LQPHSNEITLDEVQRIGIRRSEGIGFPKALLVGSRGGGCINEEVGYLITSTAGSQVVSYYNVCSQIGEANLWRSVSHQASICDGQVVHWRNSVMREDARGTVVD